jgi:hypothetical protein
MTLIMRFECVTTVNNVTILPGGGARGSEVG